MSNLYVLCKIGDSEYAIPAGEVFQMETYSGATPVPGSPSYVAGLVQIRQQIVPVLDLRIRFGLTAIERTSADAVDNRIVVIKTGERLVGLLVDSAKEVQNINTDQFHTPPEVIAQQSGGFVKSITQLKNRIIMLLDSEKVIGEEALNA